MAKGRPRNRDTKVIEITCRDSDGVMIRLPKKPDGQRPGRRRVRIIVERDVVVTPRKRTKRD